MTCLSTHSVRKSLWLIVPTVLALILGVGLMLSAPANAQGPEEAIPPSGHIPPPDSTGYLHVHVYDELTDRPLGDRVISIYDPNIEQVAQVTTTCQGYVAFDDLPTGWYRVVLEDDPDWVTERRSTASEWVLVRPYWRPGVRFYVSPNITAAGLRVYAYDSNSRQANRPREYLPGAAFTVYDADGNFVANGITGCGGFVNFNLAAGQYRVVADTQAEGAYVYPSSGERWVSLQFGTMTSTWFFTIPSPAPQATPTSAPN